MPSLQCLFCKHPNPAGASFCNDCGAQLNLQPCGQCGAIDDRAAKNCYKCGADFGLAGAPGLAAPFAPAILESELSYPALNLATVAPQQAAHDVDEAVWTDAGASPTGRQRKMRMALPALLFALIAASVYLYSKPSAPLPTRPEPPRAAAAVSAAPMPAGPTENTAQERIAPTPLPAGRGPLIAASIRPSSSLAPVAASEATSRQDLPSVHDCPPAVAALGLCSPTPKQEGQ